jgi:hypothetical protein
MGSHRYSVAARIIGGAVFQRRGATNLENRCLPALKLIVRSNEDGECHG